MKFNKIVLEKLEGVYAATQLTLGNRICACFASERAKPCVAYEAPAFGARTVLWEEPGGCMSIVPVPGRPDDFFAIQKFYRLWDWEEAALVWVHRNPDGTFICRDKATIPYLHRIDCLERDGMLYLLGCTVAAQKTSLEDWSTPGAVLAAKLPEDFAKPFVFTEILGGVYQNHGYTSIPRDGMRSSLVSTRNGGYVITPPPKGGGWTVEKIFDFAASEVAITDIDGDGMLEIAAIEPFHGADFRVYRWDGKQECVLLYDHKEDQDFYHVAIAAELGGKPAFIGGARRGKSQLFVLTWENGGFRTTLLDEGVGPTNATVLKLPGEDIVLTANRGANEVAAYRMEH